MKRFDFTITFAGYGDTAQQAWIDACENFNSDWGPAPEEYEITEDDENDQL